MGQLHQHQHYYYYLSDIDLIGYGVEFVVILKNLMTRMKMNLRIYASLMVAVVEVLDVKVAAYDDDAMIASMMDEEGAAADRDGENVNYLFSKGDDDGGDNVRGVDVDCGVVDVMFVDDDDYYGDGGAGGDDVIVNLKWMS